MFKTQQLSILLYNIILNIKGTSLRRKKVVILLKHFRNINQQKVVENY